jgi:hypothetical protein
VPILAFFQMNCWEAQRVFPPWAVRNARVLNFMTIEEAAKLGISEQERRLHIRVANGNANMGPIGKASWFKLGGAIHWTRSCETTALR